MKRNPPREPNASQLAILNDRPPSDLGLEQLARAYTRLSTCRSIGMGIGPIWTTAIDDHCDRAGIDGELREWFVDVIMLVDADALKKARDAAK